MLQVDVEAEFDAEVLKEALNHLQEAVRLDDRNLRYQRGLGEAFLAARRYREALALLERVERGRPEPRLGYLVALCHFKLGAHPAALALLRRPDGKDSVGFTRMHVLRGRILHLMGKYDDAVNEFVQAQILNPAHREARWWEAKALVAAASWRSEDTTSLYRRALKILTAHTPVPDEVDEWHLVLGRVYLALRYPVDALDHLEKSRAPAPTERAVLMGIAMLLNGRQNDAGEWLASAAATPEGRMKVEGYLTEIAASTGQALHALGSPTTATKPPLIDDTLLARVFGQTGPECDRLRRVITDRRGTVEPKTKVEALLAPARERLFAGRTPMAAGEEESPAPPAPARPVAPDQLQPQTWVDYESALGPIEPQDDDSAELDDWDLDDDVDPTIVEGAPTPEKGDA